MRVEAWFAILGCAHLETRQCRLRGQTDPATSGARHLRRQCERATRTTVFRATPHRVINRNGASRYPIPFFLGPNHDSVVDCVPTWVGPDNPPHYEPTTYGAFTQRLLTLNFAHRRAEGSEEYA